MSTWNAHSIPDLTGKVAIVTGGNAGLGFQISLELARKNATVVIACRSVEKTKDSITKIKAEINSNPLLLTHPLDLTNFESVAAFAAQYRSRFNRLDLLINNAGVVNLKEKQSTASGLEMHMATNHFGHFALTGHLFSLLVSTPHSRVVTMSSGGHKTGKIDFNDINWNQRPYHRVQSYADSKLANLLFMFSLQELFETHSSTAISVGSHPGLSATERQQTIGIGGWLSKKLAQPVWKGALPALRAATDSGVKPCDYFGPEYGLCGYPTLASISQRARDKAAAEQLWKLSEKVTNVTFSR